MSPTRTPVFVVAGIDPVAVDTVSTALAVPGTVVLHHDLLEVSLGILTRTVRSVRGDGSPRTDVTRIDLDHGCVSCAMRNDLLPMLRALHRRSGVDRIVIALDPLIEPEPLCWAIENVQVLGVPGQIDGPAGRDVRVEAVLGCLDIGTWLGDATGDVTLAEAGHGSGEDADDRTLAQVVVGHATFADGIVVHGETAEQWDTALFGAVLERLAAAVPVVMQTPERPIDQQLISTLLSAIPLGARRGRAIGPHDPLLPGRPPLDEDCGVALVEFSSGRPFHPTRLHDALDCLLDGVVCSRGRLWLATQHDEALWLESAGGGLRVATGGPWLAAMSRREVDAADPERVALAGARWDEQFGDRQTSIVALSYRGDPAHIRQTLAGACLTDAELADGPAAWSRYDDPFGTFHADPCDDPDPTADTDVTEDTDATPSSREADRS